MNISLNGIEIKDFKGIKEQTIEFNGKNAQIYADNAVGKTYFDVIAAREWYEKHLEEIERESDDNLPEDFLEQMRNEGTI